MLEEIIRNNSKVGRELKIWEIKEEEKDTFLGI